MTVLIPEIVKKINSDQVVIKYGSDYFMLSTAHPSDENIFPKNVETLAFPCDEDGTVSSWHEVAGGPYMTIADVLSEISRFGIRKD